MGRVEKRRWMGPGGPRGLQSRCEARRTSRVRSIRMHLRHGNDTAAPLWTRPFLFWCCFTSSAAPSGTSLRRPHRRSLGIVVRFASTPPSEVFTFGQFFPECPSSDVENGKNCSIFSPSSRRMRIPHYFAELWTKRMSRTPQKKRISLKWQLTKPQSATQAAVGNASRSRQCKRQSAMQVAVCNASCEATVSNASRSWHCKPQFHHKKQHAAKDRTQEPSRR